MTLVICKLTLEDDVGCFDCGHQELNEYLWLQAIPQQLDGSGTVHLALRGATLVGFITLSMAHLSVERVAEGDLPETEYRNFPSLLIGRLAVDKRHHLQDVGTRLCQFALKKAIDAREIFGCQYVIVNAKREAIGFYEKNGFRLGESQPSRREPLMYFKLPRDPSLS